MSDTYKELHKLYQDFGIGGNPGDDLFLKSFQVDAENKASLLNVVREQVGQINKDLESNGVSSDNSDIGLFCNPIIRIFQKLDRVVDYFCGEFEIQTKRKELREQMAKIWPEFIKGWYFGSIYIAYGDDFEAIDRVAFEKQGKDFELESVTGKFRLYRGSANGLFTSVFSGQSNLEFDESKRRRMVKASCDGYMNWFYWWHLWVRWLNGMDRAEASIKALSKNVVITPKNNEEFQHIEKQFLNFSPLVRRGGNMETQKGGEDSFSIGKTKFDELIFMPRETPIAIMEAVQRMFEFDAAPLGYGSKMMEQKKERINAGENFAHQKVVSNARTSLITKLNKVFDEMREKFGKEVIPEDLKIVPTNQAFAQGLPEYQHGGSFAQPFNKFNNFNRWNNKGKFMEDDKGND